MAQKPKISEMQKFWRAAENLEISNVIILDLILRPYQIIDDKDSTQTFVVRC